MDPTDLDHLAPGVQPLEKVFINCLHELSFVGVGSSWGWLARRLIYLIVIKDLLLDFGRRSYKESSSLIFRLLYLRPLGRSRILSPRS